MNEIGAVQADIIRTHSTRMLSTGYLNAAKSFDRGANSKCLRRLNEAIRQDHIPARSLWLPEPRKPLLCKFGHKFWLNNMWLPSKKSCESQCFWWIFCSSTRPFTSLNMGNHPTEWNTDEPRHTSIHHHWFVDWLVWLQRAPVPIKKCHAYPKQHHARCYWNTCTCDNFSHAKRSHQMLLPWDAMWNTLCSWLTKLAKPTNWNTEHQQPMPHKSLIPGTTLNLT